MATENVEAASGSGGPRFASDTETVGTVTVNHPLTKIEWGAEDSFTLTNTGTASLPIQGAAAENAAAAANPLLAGGRFDSSARTLGNGDVGALALNASGHALVDTGTVTITGTVVPNGTVTTVPSGTQAVSGTLSVNSHAVTNAGTFATQIDGDALTALQLIDDIVLTEDAAHGTGDKGVMPLAVRNDTLAALAGTDGDYAPIQVNANGAIYVDGSGSTQPVSGTITNVPSGTQTVSGTVTATPSGTQTVTGSIDLGATDNAVLDDIAAKAGSIQTAVETLDNAISGSEMQVDVVAGLPAGSNLIGDVGLSGARTSGGTTLYRNVDVDESEDAVKASAGQVYWIHAINLTAAVLYLQFYNAGTGSVTVGTTTPDLTFPIPTVGDTNGAGFVLSVPAGIAFGTAITIAATTTIGGSGGPAANGCVVNLGYA